MYLSWCIHKILTSTVDYEMYKMQCLINYTYITLKISICTMSVNTDFEKAIIYLPSLKVNYRNLWNFDGKR